MPHVQAREAGDDSEIDYVVPGRLHSPVWVDVFPGPSGKGVTGCRRLTGDDDGSRMSGAGRARPAAEQFVNSAPFP